MKRLAVLSVLVFAEFSTNSIALALTYDVNPVTLSNNYSVSGGYIRTNGTLGLLSASDILDYRLEIIGEIPFVFEPTNAEANIRVDGVVEATPTELILPQSTTNRNRLSFSAEVWPIHDECIPCLELLTYVQSVPTFGLPSTGIVYDLLELGDGSPEDTIFLGGSFNSQPQVEIIVASIPEPTTATLALAALSLVMGWRRRKCFRP